MEPFRLQYDRGTIIVTGGEPTLRAELPGVMFDPRTETERAEARYYRAIVELFVARKLAFTDEARLYDRFPCTLQTSRQPYPHQEQAVHTWWQQKGRGVVVLPTGTGKTFTAMLAIVKCGRPTFVVTPTIDLLHQWAWELSQAFGIPIGQLGGGTHDLQPITVSTYDSAYIYVEQWGNRYGLLIFDECHHLPGPTCQMAALAAIAPYRLGLTATPERSDGGEELYYPLIGPIVYRREIQELSGDFLARYDTQRRYVELTEEEAEQYQNARDEYRNFLTSHRIQMNGTDGWRRFILESSRSPEGRSAMLAYREQKRIERESSAKLACLQELLQQHARDQMIIFTADNATVYRISRLFFVPAITHQTKSAERKQILERFHQGIYNTVVTSQVLNEGVDVPNANIGIVLSGSGTIRENVQRLGRLLRKQGTKQSILYEIVVRGTSEEWISQRRRQHQAFE
ncbi:MAG: DEAD/DEAH box helicase family protein [Zavarzinella sp.]